MSCSLFFLIGRCHSSRFASSPVAGIVAFFSSFLNASLEKVSFVTLLLSLVVSQLEEISNCCVEAFHSIVLWSIPQHSAICMSNHRSLYVCVRVRVGLTGPKAAYASQHRLNFLFFVDLASWHHLGRTEKGLATVPSFQG